MLNDSSSPNPSPAPAQVSLPGDRELSLEARLEAILFAAPGSVTAAQLATALETSQAEIEAALAELETRYHQSNSGLRLQRHHGRFQLTTAPQATHLVERFLGLEASSRLSRAALETLAIIAYREPTTRPHVDSIRGVNSDGVLKSLLSKGLIQEVGRAEAPGRPILYSITEDFLAQFGISSLAELPTLDEAESPGSGADQDSEIEDETP